MPWGLIVNIRVICKGSLSATITLYNIFSFAQQERGGGQNTGTSFHFQYKESLITACPLPMLRKEREEYGTRQQSWTHREAICKANSLYSDIQNVSDRIRTLSPQCLQTLFIFLDGELRTRWKYSGQVVSVCHFEFFIFDKRMNLDNTRHLGASNLCKIQIELNFVNKKHIQEKRKV